MTAILLVEDNEMIQEMLRERLEGQGFQVVVAGDGVEALALARSTPLNLILMDMNLPLLDGWEATRQLKADRTTSAMPIIGVTAHAISGDREKCLAAGCDEYLSKPIDFPDLLAKIRALVA